MSESRDDTDSDQEVVNLEALLEQFREPEEPRRKRGGGAMWFILAVLVSCVAFWMAAQATRGTLGLNRAGSVKMKPTKVRERPAAPEPRNTGEVAEEFAARCRKGMTSLEIRWLVEDFRGAELDEGPGSLIERIGSIIDQFPHWAPLSEGATEKLERLIDQLAARQRSWYCSALTDALRLDAKQRAEMKGKLARIQQEERENLEQSRADSGKGGIGIPFQGITGDPLHDRLITAGEWLADERNSPWSLCELTRSQLSITRHGDVVREQLNIISSESGSDPAIPSWFALRPAAFATTAGGGRAAFDVETVKQEAEAIFPFIPAQVSANDDGLVELVKRLHPAQLKILLLLEPGLAGRLADELEKSGE